VRGADRAAEEHGREHPLPPDEAQLKSRLMQRILLNDAEIRQLAEPWLEDLDDILAGRPKTLH
jgi:flagellar protein FliT